MEVRGEHLPVRGRGELPMGKGACYLGKEDSSLLSPWVPRAHLWSPPATWVWR